MKYWSKMACLCLSACLLSVTASQAEETAAAIQPRGKTVVEIKPDRIILIDIAQAGSRLVAVGERGFALVSDDGGKTWKAHETPVTRTLTGVAFRDAQVGVAVGHGGSFVRTEDGGDKWTEIKVPEAEPESLLGVVDLGGDHFAAFGAFGMYFDSADAGRTWKRVTLFDPDFDRHISDVVRVGKTLLMVAESGTLARSDDEGATWTAMTSPYVGSYFGAVATADGTVLAFGMRGNVWRTTDLGATWQKIPLNTTASLNGGRVLSDGRILLVGNSGLLALSKDGGQTLELHWAPGGHGYAAVAEAGGHIILAGETGITTLDPSWLSSQ